MDILFVFKYRLSYIENVLYHSRIYSAKVISSTLMYLLFKSIPLMIIIIKIIIIITMVSCIILKGQCVVGIPNNQILISSIITWQVLGQAKMRGLQTDLMGKLHKTSHSCPPLQEFRHALNLCTRPVRSPQTTAIWKKERIKVSIPGQVIIPIRWAKLGLQVQVRK